MPALLVFLRLRMGSGQLASDSRRRSSCVLFVTHLSRFIVDHSFNDDDAVERGELRLDKYLETGGRTLRRKAKAV